MLVLVNGTVATNGNGEEQVAVFADDVDQEGDDGLRSFVGVVFVDGALVVPVTDAGVGLPGVLEDLRGAAALDVERKGAGGAGLGLFGEDDTLLGAVTRNRRVIEMRCNIKALLAQR